MSFTLPRLPQFEPQWPDLQVWWQQVVEAIEAQEASQDEVIAGLQAVTESLSETIIELQETIRNDARTASYTVPTDVLSATDLGGAVGSSITVIDHERVYNGDTVNPQEITGATLPGPYPYATVHWVYYDDLTLEDETPEFVATTVQKDAQAGAAPGRHFVGEVTTPASGSPPTSGTGGRPPGGGGSGGIQP